jgi:hypothetical protein
MAKTNKDKQCYTKHIEERQKIPWLKPTRTNVLLVLAMVLSDILRCVLYNIVCPCAFWPWYCLTFLLYKAHRRTSDNTMDKTNKDKRCNTKHIEERQTIPWPKRTRSNNVMQNTSKNIRQYHGQNQLVLSDVLRCVLYDIVCPCWFWL